MSISPIKGLDKQERFKRSNIYQEEFYQIKAKRLQNQNLKLQQENTLLRKRLADTQSYSFIREQNNRLKQQLAMKLQIEQSHELRRSFNQQSTYLDKQIEILRLRYERELLDLTTQNESLRSKLNQVRVIQQSELEDLKLKYTSLHLNDSQSLKSIHTQQTRFLLQEIQKLKDQLNQKSNELQIHFDHRNIFKLETDKEIGQKIKQINSLKLQIASLQQSKNSQIKEMQEKRILERSRQQIFVDNSSECANYLQSEIKKLTQELKQKNSEIQHLTRTSISQKKNNLQKQKELLQQIESIKAESEKNIKEISDISMVRQQNWQSQTADLKRQLKQIEQAKETLLRELQNLRTQYNIQTSILNDQKSENQGLKLIIEQQRLQHLQQVTKLANQNSLKRRSSRILRSQVSFNEPEITPNLQQKLPVVKQLKQQKENLNGSQIFVQEENRVNVVYELKIKELNQTHNLTINKLVSQIEKLSKLLNQKKQQIVEILRKFAPLVKIKAGEVQLDQDRKQRIQKHWKADISILEVLLRKYKVRAWEP